MGNTYIKTVSGGETTAPTGAEGVPLDDGTTSTWISVANIAEYIRTLTQTLTNKTLTTPTIADFTNAAHDHGDADDGGAVVAAAITTLHGTVLMGFTSVLAAPADATSYMFGNNSRAPSTTSGISLIYNSPDGAGTITAAYVTFEQLATTGSAETSTVAIRKDAVDTTISSVVQNDQNAETFSNTGLSIAVVQGNAFELKWTTPTWVTNPTNVRISWVIYVRR